jgi:hypothetical protein
VNKKLTKDQIQIVNLNLDSKGKLPCIKAFKVAKQIDVKLEDMMYVANSLDIKISDCELGVFGDKDLSQKDENLYNKILQNNNMNKNITCKALWDEAKASSMKAVRSTVQGSDIFTTYCQLGCFVEGKNKGKNNERKSKNLD